MSERPSPGYALLPEALGELARTTRVHVLHMIKRARASHIGSAFSVVDLLTMLYGAGVLRVSPEEWEHTDRDRFILRASKRTC